MKRLYLLSALLLACTAQAQQAWNENRLTWEAPTTCTSGQPISACPITNYRVERSSSQTGSYAALGTSTSLTYTHLSAAAGLNCYRVIAVAVTGESTPSPVACKTNVQPAGPPNPPTNLQFVTTAFVSSIDARATTPVFRLLAGNKRGEIYGLVPTGRGTEGPPVLTWRGLGYCRVFVKGKELSGTNDPNNLIAPCMPRA